MENDDASPSLTKLFRWATTPPQSYVVYVVVLLAVFGVTFLAGTLTPKKHLTVAPGAVTVPTR